jgi:hypothetical protein
LGTSLAPLRGRRRLSCFAGPILGHAPISTPFPISGWDISVSRYIRICASLAPLRGRRRVSWFIGPVHGHAPVRAPCLIPIWKVSVSGLNNIIHTVYPKIMISTIFRHSLSILLFLFKPEFLKPDPVLISMWLCRFRIRK